VPGTYLTRFLLVMEKVVSFLCQVSELFDMGQSVLW